jgi:hypothetical protein
MHGAKDHSKIKFIVGPYAAAPLCTTGTPQPRAGFLTPSLHWKEFPAWKGPSTATCTWTTNQ